MISEQFLNVFKEATERKWSFDQLRKDVYGFQFRAGTYWNEGLSEEKLRKYENAVGFDFPADLRLFHGR